MRTVEFEKKKKFSGKSWVYQICYAVHEVLGMSSFFFCIERVISLKICIQFHLWNQVLIYIFVTAETKVKSKCSNTGGQWIEGNRFWVFVFIFICLEINLLLCNSHIVSHGYLWWLKMPKESSWFKSVTAEPWLSISILLCFWQITSDYLIFIVSLLNLTHVNCRLSMVLASHNFPFCPWYGCWNFPGKSQK